ncbi:vinorine synthase-like [Pyrus ussuriensis x Pyrus communis]|uniref:Vinorine synthase-like n=1 Tax=Pyrus ussuriensis x Pyrus communis TaxID=2448454 RepID=A0A5N5FUJ7_9ROSA|nr:vinorine synthase-like [Pyrus ussuriensis x Pyrus communis]
MVGSEMKVEVIHKEAIRPSSTTPHYLKTTNLSVFDQLIPDIYVPFLLFYPNNNTDHRSLAAERSKILKTSLSEILTHFYPFAGKFHYNDSICCNDHGVAFLEAQVNCPISKILDKADIGMVKQLLPADMASRQAVTGYLLLVQANFFECGGMAIGVSIAHKVADASTISTFIKRWAEIALDSTSRPNTDCQAVLPAEFGVAASLFPPQDILNAPQPTLEFPKEKCITRTYLFDASKIAALKSKSASATVPKPTRIEVVSAFIWKCAMEASKSKFGSIRPSAWCHAVNMRNVLVRPSAKNLLGNLVGKFIARAGESEVVDLDLQSLVGKLRKGIEEFKVKYANNVTGDACESLKEYGDLLQMDDIEIYTCSSWCRFPFYAADFGWGKPSWVNQSLEGKNLIVLMDVRDGDGVEVSLTFNEEDMAIIESNNELLAYASLGRNLILQKDVALVV